MIFPEQVVAKPALALIETMAHLTDGWSSGLAGCGGYCWFVALSQFTNAISENHNLDLIDPNLRSGVMSLTVCFVTRRAVYGELG